MTSNTQIHDSSLSWFVQLLQWDGTRLFTCGAGTENTLVLAHLAKSKLSFCHHFASVIYRPSLSSVNFSHFNLLL
jgi:hypothetical protein